MFGTKQDPYVRLSWGGAASSARSSIKADAGREADWGEEQVSLTVHARAIVEECALLVEVWNDNPGPDTLIGFTTLPLAQLVQDRHRREVPHTLQLEPRKKGG